MVFIHFRQHFPFLCFVILYLKNEIVLVARFKFVKMIFAEIIEFILMIIHPVIKKSNDVWCCFQVKYLILG